MEDNNVEIAATLANYYVEHRENSPELIYEFMTVRGVNSDNIHDIFDQVELELIGMRDGDTDQIVDNYIIGKKFLGSVDEFTLNDILEKPKDAHYLIKIASKLAYAYQLKYSLDVISSMISDSGIWNKITFH